MLFGKADVSNMNKMKNLKFLFTRAWALAKGYFLLCLAKNLFSGLMPLANVFGVGIIVDALLTEKSQEEIILSLIHI